MDDNILPYGLSFILLCLLLFTIKKNKRVGWINLLLFTAYSGYLYHGLFFRGAGGVSLVWWFYLLLFTGIHLLLIIIYFFVVNWQK